MAGASASVCVVAVMAALDGNRRLAESSRQTTAAKSVASKALPEASICGAGAPDMAIRKQIFVSFAWRVGCNWQT